MWLPIYVPPLLRRDVKPDRVAFGSAHFRLCQPLAMPCRCFVIMGDDQMLTSDRSILGRGSACLGFPVRNLRLRACISMQFSKTRGIILTTRECLTGGDAFTIAKHHRSQSA